MRPALRSLSSVSGILLALLLGVSGTAVAPAADAGAETTYPIKHVVIILQENHSFDNVLGSFCQAVSSHQITRPGPDDSCDGVTQGITSAGQTVPLVESPDLVPASIHNAAAQISDIDGGKMDGFDLTAPCNTAPNDCYSQYGALSGPCSAGTCEPNLITLATKYAVSDRTFELEASPSYGGHFVFATASLDGFSGDIPTRGGSGPRAVGDGPGWGCDSGGWTEWTGTNGQMAAVPACVPNSAGSLGPNWAGYTGTTAAYIPTIFDELDAAGLSWKLYGGDGAPVGDKMYQQSGWQWTICPYFAECLYSSQRNNLQSAAQIETDAAGSHLPSFSIVTPTSSESQHNGWDMTEGDNFIGQVVSSLQKSRQWGSTAVFITYDDCGCFYDHVNPVQYNATWGIRVPLVIVSPYVTAGYTDSTPTTFAGILAFAETMLGVPPLNSNDASAYNYLNAFCWRPAAQHCVRAGVAPVTLISQATTPYTAAERAAQEVDARDDT